MRTLSRAIILPAALAAVIILLPSVAAAQVGIGGRLAWIKADSELDDDSVRFTGGHIRLLSPRWGLELSMDQHSETFEAADEKITDRPVQASLLLRLGGGGFSPYLLGGPGWYRRTVELLGAPEEEEQKITDTEFGWHAGFGLELRPARHFGIHADYRYTFLDFNDDDEEDEGFISGLLPGHRGSMWTVGATIYF